MCRGIRPCLAAWSGSWGGPSWARLRRAAPGASSPGASPTDGNLAAENMVLFLGGRGRTSHNTSLLEIIALLKNCFMAVPSQRRKIKRQPDPPRNFPIPSAAQALNGQGLLIWSSLAKHWIGPEQHAWLLLLFQITCSACLRATILDRFGFHFIQQFCNHG